MGLFGGRQGSNNKVRLKALEEGLGKTGFVYEIVLDETSPLLIDIDDKSTYIGAVKFRVGNDKVTDPTKLPWAFPFDKHTKSLPIKQELVEIQKIGLDYTYRRIGREINPSRTSSGNAINHIAKPQEGEQAKLGSYQENSEGAAVKSSDTETEVVGYGNYYLPQDNIHKLKLYEGDTSIESRYGQSIRFTAYNNTAGGNDAQGKPKPAFAPTLIIRNGESSRNRKLPENVTAEEDVNRDGGVIAFGSAQYELQFQPGTVDDNGKSDFTTKPESFLDYPSKLIGDQILINSGRIILSAKNAEMMFYSKKNYGFVSDGGLSIDNKLGINVSVGDDINVVTNNRDVKIYSGKGSIFLGDQAPLEPLVKGTQLVKILHELITAISNQTFLTPSGPTDIGPTNLSEFQAISNKLNDILSKLNQTA
jgi:hypothetical protein